MRKPSQKDIILKELRTNGSVSRNWALQHFISRLGALICDMRKDGMNIEAEWKDGDYLYRLKDKPKQKIVYRVNGEIVAEKVIW